MSVLIGGSGGGIINNKTSTTKQKKGCSQLVGEARTREEEGRMRKDRKDKEGKR
jgi:hypothetical protein